MYKNLPPQIANKRLVKQTARTSLSFTQGSVLALFAALLCVFSISKAHAQTSIYMNENVLSMQPAIALKGLWIKDQDGSSLLDPQTSGLIANDQGLWSVSDASSHESQLKMLHLIDKQSAQIIHKYGPMKLSESVQNTCFADYLGTKPDYEAMVFNPFKQNSWILVTEDASRGNPLTPTCLETFSGTGSTIYPTLLVELTLQSEQLIVSGVRAVQFDSSENIGDFPNDGVEGLAFGRNNRLYLGLEKDANNQPRVFYVDMNEEFFTQPSTFIRATDAGLKLPKFTAGNHPINGMDIYFPDAVSQGFLIAAARNDEQLWIIDLSKQQPTKIVPLSFFAPSTSAECPSAHQMDNASLEGVAVDGNTLVLVNDPWRLNYAKNIVCEADRALYERMSPLIFSLTMPSEWFQS